MARLLMEVESVQAALAKMRQEHVDILTDINKLTIHVHQVIGSSWSGPASIEFGNTFDELVAQLKDQLRDLEELSLDLQKEIEQWKETSARLG